MPYSDLLVNSRLCWQVLTRALHDLALALAYVQEQLKQTVSEMCKIEIENGLLFALLIDIDSALPVPASEVVIRVGRRVLGMGPMDARLYVLSCFVNLAYLGGAGQLRFPPDGQSISACPCDSCIHVACATRWGCGRHCQHGRQPRGVAPRGEWAAVPRRATLQAARRPATGRAWGRTGPARLLLLP